MRPIADLLICLRFFSRLPVPATRRECELGAGGLTAAAAMVPVAGAVLGLVPAAALLASAAIGLPALPTAALAVAALVVATGALHEDGLADCADGFGGGRSPEHKLAIMRDSRIGAFGTCAVALSLLLRTSCLAVLAERGPWLAAMAAIVAAAWSRTACLVPLRALPPARGDGLGAGAGRPTKWALTLAIAIALWLAVPLLPLGIAPSRIAMMTGLVAISTALVSRLAKRQIGGQTGDVIGTIQQAAECAALLSLSAAA